MKVSPFLFRDIMSKQLQDLLETKEKLLFKSKRKLSYLKEQLKEAEYYINNIEDIKKSISEITDPVYQAKIKKDLKEIDKKYTSEVKKYTEIFNYFGCDSEFLPAFLYYLSRKSVNNYSVEATKLDITKDKYTTDIIMYDNYGYLIINLFSDKHSKVFIQYTVPILSSTRAGKNTEISDFRKKLRDLKFTEKQIQNFEKRIVKSIDFSNLPKKVKYPEYMKKYFLLL